jgi:uncharacterized membrane protein YphA (DoxX/SURF4 family)
MSTVATTRSSYALPIYTTVLAWLFVAACLFEAIYQPVFDKANSQVIGDAGYLVAAVLVAAGLLTSRRTSPWLSVTLVTLGALVGGAMLVWTLVVPVLALVLIVLVVLNARRGAAVAAKPAAS